MLDQEKTKQKLHSRSENSYSKSLKNSRASVLSSAKNSIKSCTNSTPIRNSLVYQSPLASNHAKPFTVKPNSRSKTNTKDIKSFKSNNPSVQIPILMNKESETKFFADSEVANNCRMNLLKKILDYKQQSDGKKIAKIKYTAFNSKFLLRNKRIKPGIKNLEKYNNKIGHLKSLQKNEQNRSTSLTSITLTLKTESSKSTLNSNESLKRRPEILKIPVSKSLINLITVPRNKFRVRSIPFLDKLDYKPVDRESFMEFSQNFDFMSIFENYSNQTRLTFCSESGFTKSRKLNDFKFIIKNDLKFVKEKHEAILNDYLNKFDNLDVIRKSCERISISIPSLYDKHGSKLVKIFSQKIGN
jgi:hypothetical protein